MGGLLALAAAMGIGRFVYTPILPSMIDQIPITHSAAGLIASANFVGYLAGALAASLGTLLGSERRWFLGCLLLSAATTAAMALTTSVAAFLVLRFLGGVASAFVLVFSSALILDHLKAADKPGYSALHFAGVGSGIALSALVVAVLLAEGIAWQSLWITSSVITVLCLVGAFYLVPSDPPRLPINESANAPAKSQTSELRRLILAYGLFGFGYVITATFISEIVRDAPALKAAEPYVWLAVGLAAAPSVYYWSKVASSIGGRLAFAIACVVEAGSVILSVVAASPALIILASLLFGATFMGITALGLMEARKLTPGAERRTLAIMTASFGLGQIIGPLLAGFLRDAAGSFVIASCVAAAALLFAAMLTGRRLPSQL